MWDKPIRDVENLRLQKTRERMMQYNIIIKWVPGKTHYVADALSRQPLFNVMDDEEDTCSGVEEFHLRKVSYSSHGKAREDKKLDMMFDMAKEDSYQQVVTALLEDREVGDLPSHHPAKEFREVWDRISLSDTGAYPLMILDDSKIVVPVGARKEILRLLHLPHCGISKTRQSASSDYYWPGLGRKIEEMCGKCPVCRAGLPSQKCEPMMEDAVPFCELQPMMELGTDLFEVKGKHWLVAVDRYSGWPMYVQTKRCGTADVTKELENWFDMYGYPRKLRADWGPAFRQKFTDWCTDHHIEREISSAYNAASNGLAEAGVARVKKCIRRAQGAREHVDKALSAFKAMKMVNQLSPNEMFFGRVLRGDLPILEKRVDRSKGEELREKARDAYIARDAGKVGAPVLHVKDKVWMQNQLTKLWDIAGVVTKVRDKGKSYYVESYDGGEYLRNRKFLKQRKYDTNMNEALDGGASGADAAERPADADQATLRRSPRIAGRVRFSRDTLVRVYTRKNRLCTFTVPPRGDV